MLEPEKLPALTPSVRAQLLATEHWSILASRSTTQAVALTRISIFLTLVFAGLVTLALVGQATEFSEAFGVFAIAVLAMNRLRAAYVDLDPGIAFYLMASPYDDQAGSNTTYDMTGSRGAASQVLGSSAMFISLVNATLVGLLAAALCNVFLAPMGVIVTVGVVVGLAYAALIIARGGMAYSGFWKTYVPRNPSPEE